MTATQIPAFPSGSIDIIKNRELEKIDLVSLYWYVVVHKGSLHFLTKPQLKQFAEYMLRESEGQFISYAGANMILKKLINSIIK